MKAFNIRWNADKRISQSLPQEIEIPKKCKTTDQISDYVSSIGGCSHLGFAIKYTPSEIREHQRKCKFEEMKE